MELHRGDTEVERGKEVVVLDASVVVKWFVKEKHADSASKALLAKVAKVNEASHIEEYRLRK